MALCRINLYFYINSHMYTHAGALSCGDEGLFWWLEDALCWAGFQLEYDVTCTIVSIHLECPLFLLHCFQPLPLPFPHCNCCLLTSKWETLLVVYKLACSLIKGNHWVTSLVWTISVWYSHRNNSAVQESHCSNYIYISPCRSYCTPTWHASRFMSPGYVLCKRHVCSTCWVTHCINKPLPGWLTKSLHVM